MSTLAHPASFDTIAGPRMPPLGQTVRLLRDPNGFLVGAWRQYGDIFRIRIQVMGDVLVVADPSLTREILLGDQSLFLGGAANQLAEPMIGTRSLFLTDGDDHVWQRRLMLPSFHARKLQSYAKQIEAIAAKRLAALPVERPAPTRPVMQAIAMDVILEIVFGVSGPAAERLRTALVAMRGPLGTIIMLPWMRRDLGAGSPWRVFLRRRASVDELIAAEIAARRAEPGLEERSDALSMLLLARDGEGNGLSDADIRDQLLTLVTAGYETTATGLAWAVERLSRHEDVLATAHAAAAEGNDAYLTSCARETLRVRPPLYHIARRLGRQHTFAGYRLPAGLALMIPILLLHQRADLYENPAEFRPERFLGDHLDPLEWLPFGGGPRRCVGAYLAELEMTIVLRELLTRYTIRPAAHDEPMRIFHVTLVPGRGGVAVLDRA